MTPPGRNHPTRGRCRCRYPFLQAVAISCPGFTPDDNYFHLAPHREKRIVFTPSAVDAVSFKAHFEPLNVAEAGTVRATRSTAGENWGQTPIIATQ